MVAENFVKQEMEDLRLMEQTVPEMYLLVEGERLDIPSGWDRKQSEGEKESKVNPEKRWKWDMLMVKVQMLEE